MSTAYNFSKLKSREKRVYTISDIKVSSTGLNTKMLAICGALVAVSLILNIGICMFTGIWYINPITPDGFFLDGILMVLAVPIAIGCGLYYGKIQNYRIFDFLVVYLKPKHAIDLQGKQIKEEQIVFDAYVENQKHP